MESFTNIENFVSCVITDAKCCMGQRGYDFVNEKNHGRENENKYWEILQLNAYIKALTRYEEEASCRCKGERKVINPNKNKVCLNPQINSLPLGIESIDCKHCLTEIEVLRMTEVIKIFCSTCDCNCN